MTMIPGTNGYRRLDHIAGAIRDCLPTTRLFAGSVARERARTKGIALLITGIIVVGLTLASTSAGGVTIALTGDDEVEQDGVVTFEVTVEHEGNDSVETEGYLLTIADPDGNSMEQVFTSHGEPISTESDSDNLDDRQLDPNLEMKDSVPLLGYEERPGYEDRPGYEHATISETIVLEITVDAEAFDVNEYEAQVQLISDGSAELPTNVLPSTELETTHPSNVHSFAVTETDEPTEPEKTDERPTECEDDVDDRQVIVIEDATITVAL